MSEITTESSLHEKMKELRILAQYCIEEANNTLVQINPKAGAPYQLWEELRGERYGLAQTTDELINRLKLIESLIQEIKENVGRQEDV